MTIEEYLNSIGFTEETTAFMQFFLSAKLINAIDANPKFAFFSFLMKTALNGYGRSGIFIIDRVKFLAFCDSIGVNTLDDVNQFCEVTNGKVIIDILDPIIEVERNIKLNFGKIIDLIKAQCNVEPDCLWVLPGDIDYWAIAENDLGVILAKSPVDKFRYLVESHDCDDFSRELRAWISSKYLGDMAFGQVDTNNYKDGKVISAHAICIAVLEDESVVLIEPQTDRIYNPDEIVSGFGIDEEKIRQVQF